MPTVERNLNHWRDEHTWPKGGDEWTEMAEACKIPYPQWKASLVKEVFGDCRGLPVLEIGCGRGRWTRILAQQTKDLWAVDLVERNIKHCQSLCPNVKYLVTQGPMPSFPSGTRQAIISFDTFVHIDPAETRVYMKEFERLLAPGGRAIIHHPDEPNNKGWRSDVTGKMIRRMALDAGLVVTHQLDSWGPGYKCNVRLAGDLISHIVKV